MRAGAAQYDGAASRPADRPGADAPDADMAEEAAAWFSTMLDPDVSAEDQQAFRAWIGQGPLQSRAFHEMELIWGAAAALPDRGRGLSRRAALRGVAGLGLLAGLGWWAAHPRPDFSSKRGQVLAANLPGGTGILLSAASELSLIRLPAGKVAKDDQVRLMAGSAWFGPGANGLSVEARSFRLTRNDPDSAFAVSLLARGPRAMVERGTVTVSLGDDTATLAAGEVLSLDEAQGAYSRESRDVAALLSWREGRLSFEHEPLDNIIAELNNWRPGHLMLMDDSLRNRQATLMLPSTSREKTDLALREGLGLRLVDLTPALTLIYAG